MSTQPGQQTDFGANEWLVYEIHQQYLKDPESVSEAWREFLSDYDPGQPGASTNGGSAPAPQQAAPAQEPAAPVAEKPAAAAAPAPAGAPAPAPAQAKRVVAAPAEGAHTTPLKGAAARVVSNMEASLAVPTATSVRSVPAKLLADNRIVINSHLKRSRGGKVSFTHLIGYALVRAVADVPVMNNSYAEVDGKPVVVTPDNVGLGLAIDLQNANGTRSLVVAAIKNADSMD
ncbi:MAG: multifunctional oxoglutarate decarboxylase/oxoglutarate dehydrogenase thiamine pyrophosphate-binding subunit/dihydrolipoyllysine-residue succinyltransferase subunit, partial [Frankiales bacterium]